MIQIRGCVYLSAVKNFSPLKLFLPIKVHAASETSMNDALYETVVELEEQIIQTTNNDEDVEQHDDHDDHDHDDHDHDDHDHEDHDHEEEREEELSDAEGVWGLRQEPSANLIGVVTPLPLPSGSEHVYYEDEEDRSRRSDDQHGDLPYAEDQEDHVIYQDEYGEELAEPDDVELDSESEAEAEAEAASRPPSRFSTHRSQRSTKSRPKSTSRRPLSSMSIRWGERGSLWMPYLEEFVFGLTLFGSLLRTYLI